MSATKTVTSVRSLSYNHLVPKLRHPSNPVCFLDIQIGNVDVGRLSLELFADVCPKTAENFRQFCTGEFKINGEPKGYKGCNFNRIIKDFMVQGGDVPFNDGSGMMSIYGPKFADENFIMKHDSPGLLCMANANEKDTNGCQFYITCVRCDFLDGTNVVFGRVVDGMLVLRKMENVPVGPGDKPRLPVTIANCGQL